MKKKTNRWLNALTLFLIISTLSCASSPIQSPPSLENRTLRISEKVPGFEYQWRECAKKFLGMCTKWEMRVEYYDLTDIAVRQKLIAMGFVARIRENVTP